MKVNQTMGFEHYQNYVQNVKGNDAALAKATAAELRPETTEAANIDKVDFSENGAARAGLLRMSSAIAQEVEGHAGAQRLAQLQAQIEQGTYRMETGQIADAILGVFEK